MFDRFSASVLAVTAFVMGAFTLASPAYAETFGIWKNPSNTVHVEIYDCGSLRCGRVVWASEKAKKDARKGSGKDLIGMTILRDFREYANGVWRGKAYIPDLNREFSGSAELIGTRQLKVRGCLLGRVGCKSQVWTRI